MAPWKKAFKPHEAEAQGHSVMTNFFKVKRKPGRPKTKRNLAGDDIRLTATRRGRPPSSAKKDSKTESKSASAQKYTTLNNPNDVPTIPPPKKRVNWGVGENKAKLEEAIAEWEEKRGRYLPFKERNHEGSWWYWCFTEASKA